MTIDRPIYIHIYVQMPIINTYIIIVININMVMTVGCKRCIGKLLFKCVQVHEHKRSHSEILFCVFCECRLTIFRSFQSLCARFDFVSLAGLSLLRICQIIDQHQYSNSTRHYVVLPSAGSSGMSWEAPNTGILIYGYTAQLNDT